MLGTVECPRIYPMNKSECNRCSFCLLEKQNVCALGVHTRYNKNQNSNSLNKERSKFFKILNDEQLSEGGEAKSYLYWI